MSLLVQDSLTYTSARTCDDGTRELAANGIPDQEVGTFPNPGNPNVISEQSGSASFCLVPSETGTATGSGRILHITVSRKSAQLRHEFALTPAQPVAELFPATDSD
ncbi:hypothetical protein Q4485_14975 [Granulosicoccaceae sp. 1_MG-2023]|nr:hypothetical protein [Granulosicoccaceae sp. 1_MG-2023]